MSILNLSNCLSLSLLSKRFGFGHQQKIMSSHHRRGDRNRKRHLDGGDSRKPRNGRHPSHLKGKEIGLFYANRNKTVLEEALRSLGSIHLSQTTKVHLKNIISTLDNTSSFSNAETSSFKQHFHNFVKGDISEKLNKAVAQIEPDPRIDDRLYEHYISQKETPKYKQMLHKRQILPSYKMRNELLKVIEENQVVVISGETGCGKTTQVAQFILDDYLDKKRGSVCKIICTQPRRISAISVAERVAEERAERLGLSVGYQIRLEKNTPREFGSICYCTTGVVLRQMETEPSLKGVSHLILDEIHERNVISDFLITMLKQILLVRKDLKVILMSATLNAEQFSQYYNNCPHVNIPGFTYPVEEFFLEDVIERTGFVFQQMPSWLERRKREEIKEFNSFIFPHVRLLQLEKKYNKNVLRQLQNPQSEELNLELVFELIKHICMSYKDNGSILVFLPGYGEISSLNTLIEKSGRFPRNQYIIIPLHSMMATTEQKRIFQQAPTGMRKIIISTNIAETSITIDDVVYVIDGGKIKQSSFDVQNNMKILKAEWVSLANASQRKGRAGRVKSGVCFHLYSKARQMMLEQYQTPEILREPLDNTILKAKILQLGKVEPFFQKLLSAPNPEAVTAAIDFLKRLDALDDEENLTPLGYHLARLPINSPQIGKMVLFGALFSCLDPILSIAATLDFKEPFQIPLTKTDEAQRKKVELADGCLSDHLLYHQVIRTFESCQDQRRFCWDYYLSAQTLKLLVNMKNDFMGYLNEMNFVAGLDCKSAECNVNSENLSLVKAVITAGLYPNVAIVKPSKYPTFMSIDRQKLAIHQKSILSDCRRFDSPLLVYYLQMKSTTVSMFDASMVYPLPIVFFGDHYKHGVDNGHHFISINEKIRFKCSESTADIIKELRGRLNEFLEYKVTHPGAVNWGDDGDVVKFLSAIKELITAEDQGVIDIDAFDDCD